MAYTVNSRNEIIPIYSGHDLEVYNIYVNLNKKCRELNLLLTTQSEYYDDVFEGSLAKEIIEIVSKLNEEEKLVFDFSDIADIRQLRYNLLRKKKPENYPGLPELKNAFVNKFFFYKLAVDLDFDSDVENELDINYFE